MATPADVLARAAAIYSAAADTVRAVRPALARAFVPWERIETPATLAALFAAAGVHEVESVAERDAHPLESPEDVWHIARGSGYRGALEQLTAGEQDRVRLAVIGALRDAGTRALTMDVIDASARRVH